jgi:hypothetical protein
MQEILRAFGVFRVHGSQLGRELRLQIVRMRDDFVDALNERGRIN